eukprot:TRINITY_DN5115_c0_g1_i2.p1 TRINITY_DN5115_c0_g1~~TRINITY_DN5115_c0_g1_i2.p1  ORF type:complete len:119 (-),score=7.06 TRINITY_DN5115_c0_g1_i2:25-381(-)
MRICLTLTVLALALPYLAYANIIPVSLIGNIASIFSITLFASPLLDLNRVITTKSMEGLSLSSTILQIGLTLLWTLYGYLTANSSVILPNVLGCFLSCSQLVLFGLYGTHKPVSNSVV